MSNLTRSIVLLSISVLAVMVAFAQAPSSRQAFEVASIKPSTTSVVQAIVDGSFLGLEIKPGRVRMGHMSVGSLILLAYNIKREQLEGPSWLLNSDESTATFDIEAKLPEGAGPDQVSPMLQALLRDRFKLSVHSGSKEIDVYALIVGRNGPMLSRKENATEAETVPSIDPDAVGKQDAKGNRHFVVGSAKLTVGRDGVAHVETATLQGLANYLSGRIAPNVVVDKTGLQGNFDIKIDIPRTDRSGLPAGRDSNLAAFEERTIDNLSSVLDRLGLKLARQKSPIETIIVDHIEKNPTEN